MKFLAVLLSVATVAVALDDWSHLIPKDIYPPGFEAALGSAPGRIVGGTQAKAGDFPYQAALSIDDKSFCGGSLIDELYVLTAAHCVSGAKKVTVRLGIQASAQTPQNGEQKFIVEGGNIMTHESWMPSVIRNDVAVLRLPRPAILGGNVQTIPLASDTSNTYVGAQATASGWGKTSDGIGGVAANLMSVKVPVISNADCAKTYGTSIVTAGNVCIDGSGGKSTCNGDSGGPLVVGEGNSRVLVGVTSFGSSAGCQRGYPAAFARVTYFRNWILSKMV